MVYLDNAATTRVCAEAAEVALGVMREDFGNTSSTYAEGRRAAELLESARSHAAALLGAQAGEVCFTSGGTEANNWALKSSLVAMRRVGNHIITSLAEHDSVLQTAKHLEKSGCEVTYLRPDADGIITARAVAEVLREDTALVSVMLVNNETGAINPVAEYAAEIKRRRLSAMLHTDAVQAYGKLPFTAKSLGADLITVSAHKIHGAKGAGALFIRNGIKLPALLHGGSQEGSLRPGTHAMPAIAAFGEAARLARANAEDHLHHVCNLRTYAAAALNFPGVRILSPQGDLSRASPYILSISLPGHRSETLMNALERDGICVARSSACKKGARSHVLEAMGLRPEVIDGALRVSFSGETTEDEIGFFAERLRHISETLFHR